MWVPNDQIALIVLFFGKPIQSLVLTKMKQFSLITLAKLHRIEYAHIVWCLEFVIWKGILPPHQHVIYLSSICKLGVQMSIIWSGVTHIPPSKVSISKNQHSYVLWSCMEGFKRMIVGDNVGLTFNPDWGYMYLTLPYVWYLAQCPMIGWSTFKKPQFVKLVHSNLGASTVKLTTLDSCTSFNESE